MMQNQAGEFVECSQNECLFVKAGTAYSPTFRGLLPGITREFVMALAAEIGIPAREAA